MAEYHKITRTVEAFHQENVPKVVERTLSDDTAPPPNKLKAIAVPLGPGHNQWTKVALQYAQALGNKFSVPVIPVNLAEAHVFAPRLLGQLEFPYISVLTTGKQMELILTRGVGLHTVMGMTIDTGPEPVFRRIGFELANYCRPILLDEAQVLEFVKQYNASNTDKIPDKYFSDLEELIDKGETLALVEKLGRFGDVRAYPLPSAILNDATANLSFAGLQSTFLSNLYHLRTGKHTDSISIAKKDIGDITFQRIAALCASLTFAAFSQIEDKLFLVMAYCVVKEIPLTKVALVGSLAAN